MSYFAVKSRFMQVLYSGADDSQPRCEFKNLGLGFKGFSGLGV